MEDADVWRDDLDDFQYQREMNERHHNRLSSTLFNAGFREGLSETMEDAAVQAGFNIGFREAAAAAYRRSSHQSFLAAWHAANPEAGYDHALLEATEWPNECNPFSAKHQ